MIPTKGDPAAGDPPRSSTRTRSRSDAEKVARGGRSAKQKGSRNERKAVKELNRHLKTLYARRVPGSGAFSYRFGGPGDPHFAGDVQIRRNSNHSTVEYIEVKARDPGKCPITIAQMNGWREGRRILMARHDRGLFLCSMWATVWDELKGDDFAHPSVLGGKTRGVQLQQVAGFVPAGSAVLWGGVAYMDVRTLCELLEWMYADQLDGATQ